MGYSTSLNFNLIISIASWFQNLDFKIQILAGNSLKICLGTCFEISMTLIKLFFFVFHPILMELGEIVVHIGFYNFTKFHQNQMKNKKVLFIAHNATLVPVPTWLALWLQNNFDVKVNKYFISSVRNILWRKNWWNSSYGLWTLWRWRKLYFCWTRTWYTGNG